MSLNTKKYWLDGIFDDEEFVVPKEDLKPQVEVKSLSLTSPVVENSSSSIAEKEIVAKWSWKEEILCRDYVYCANAGCGKRHYYKRSILNRLEKIKMITPSLCKREDRIVLDRTMLRFKREGAKIIYR
jgi:hypothetical protein